MARTPRLTEAEYERFNPFAEAEWRWRRAGDLLASSSQPSALNDPLVAEVFSYRSALVDAEKDGQRETVRFRWPALALAHAIYEENGPKRWEIEARLLARESFKQIASKVDLPPEVVGMFERIFFNVADRRGTDWILTRAIRIRTAGPAGPSEREVWAYMGFAGGPHLVDLLAADYLGRPEPAMPDRHRRAQQARLCTRMYCTPQSDKAAAFKLIQDAEALFDLKLTSNRADPRQARMATMFNFLRMAAGVRPSAEKQAGSKPAATKAPMGQDKAATGEAAARQYRDQHAHE